MLLPNKVVKYEESVFPAMVAILREINKAPCSIESLYVKTRFSSKSVSTFIDALDVLYVLSKIDIDENSGVITYVN